MRRSYIMRRGKNLMGKETEATLNYGFAPNRIRDEGLHAASYDPRIFCTELTINRAARKVRLRKGDKISISVPFMEKERSKALYRVTRVIANDPEKLVVMVELVWEPDDKRARK